MKNSTFILLVEDDQSMLDGMNDLFQMPDLLQTVGIDYDIEIKTASNGQEALDIMAEHTPDLIVSDIMMPVLDGHQLLKKVQAHREWLHIPFIFLTARGNKKEILEGQLRGVDLYVTKPFASMDLLELIKSQLDKSFQRQKFHEQYVADLKKGILQVLNHEFRTPLTYVTAYYEMLATSLKRFPNNEDFQEYLRGIQTGCVRLTRLIEDLIYVIELRTGEYQMKFQERAQPVPNINSLVQSAIQEHETQIDQKNIQIHFTPYADTPAIFGDEEGLQNIFSRLLDNAIKFTPTKSSAGKQIFVTTKVQADKFHISFQDEGSGFPRSIRSHIFNLFFQYNRGIMEQQGAGTGLTIAKGLVDLHHGRIEVESEEDVGSTFTVILPLHKGTGTLGQYDPAANELQSRKMATILVVEDEESLLMGLKERLEISDSRYQFNVLIAANGQEGLEVLQDHQPDLIISDIMMPIMDGYEFLFQVRQNPDYISIPFIFLTAKGERQDIHRGLRSGAEVYIPKPYDSNELIQLIGVQLDHYFQLQAVRSQGFETLKRSILSLITPDFRLPLSAVQEYSKALETDLTDIQNDAELKESLHGIRDGSIRLTRLVEDFISLAELKTGEAEMAFSLRAQPIYKPGFLLNEAKKMCAPQAKEANVQIHFEIHSDLPPIYGDEVTLADGLGRLLEMCIRLCAHSENRTIRLSATRAEDSIHLLIGLPPELEESDFEKMIPVFVENELDLLEQIEYPPSVRIARSYIGLNNGRFQIKKSANNAFNIIISLPLLKLSDTVST